MTRWCNATMHHATKEDVDTMKAVLESLQIFFVEPPCFLLPATRPRPPMSCLSIADNYNF
jgi:hypothetical protein